MVMMTGKYLGQKRCEHTHTPSESKIQTDAPVDNNGKGETFSPTDLVATALGACMITVMGIYAEKNDMSIEGAKYEVTKKMKLTPRMIAELEIKVSLPKALTSEQRTTLENIANNCPVKLSLHPDVKIPLSFHYDV